MPNLVVADDIYRYISVVGVRYRDKQLDYKSALRMLGMILLVYTLFTPFSLTTLSFSPAHLVGHAGVSYFTITVTMINLITVIVTMTSLIVVE